MYMSSSSRPPHDLLRKAPEHAPPMHIDLPVDLLPADAKKPGSMSSGTFYSTAFLTTAVPTGIVEGVLQWVPAMRSASIAGIVGLAAAVSSVAAVYAARAAANVTTAPLSKHMLAMVAVNSAVNAMLASAILSRLDLRMRGATSGVVVGFMAGWGGHLALMLQSH